MTSIHSSRAALPHAAVQSDAAAHDRAANGSLHDVPEEVQRHVMAIVVDAPLRDASVGALRGALLTSKTFLARVNEAIADRMCRPSKEQQGLKNDREFGFALTRARFEALKRSNGDAFRAGLRELLQRHRHVEISFAEHAFKPEVDVFGKPVGTWPARSVRSGGAEPSGAASARGVKRKRYDDAAASAAPSHYLPIDAEQRRIVLDELAQAPRLANLRLNASCPAASKADVLALLDALAEAAQTDEAQADDGGRARAEARGSGWPRIELAFHHDADRAVLDDASRNDARIDAGDFRRLTANPLIARLELIGSSERYARVNIDPVLRSSTIEHCHLENYELACSRASAGQTVNQALDSIAFRHCTHAGRHGYEEVLWQSARCPSLKSLSFEYMRGERYPYSVISRMAKELARSSQGVEKLTLINIDVTDDDVLQVLEIPTLKSLRVHDNHVSSRVADAIATHPALEEIDLSLNHFDADGARALARSERLMRINLRDNRIDHDDAPVLSRTPGKDILLSLEPPPTKRRLGFD